ncbi:MAG: hypothetical protein GF350_00460 [Chitinivibrionales bacterium]|nr:hypothetical protein [Chitinivibrionales bacterium]
MMNNRSCFIIFFVVVLMTEGFSQTVDEGPTDGSFTVRGTVVEPSATRVASSGESSYKSRVGTLVHADTWSYGSGAGDTDVGKRDWPAFLAELYEVRNNSSAAQSMIDGDGLTLLRSESAGSFYKAFSCPGFSMFYFTYKDKLNADHLDAVDKTLNTVKGHAKDETGWQCLMREDRHIDPIYSVTEKNSENYCWMSRIAGLQFAHEFNSQHRSYFVDFMDNLVRGTFSAGRVEWDSNNYFGYCFQPLLVLYEHAPNDKIKRQAQAMLDWMLISSALHYLDGALVGPDIRAKSNDYTPFSGSFWPYGYAYFGGKTPSYSTADADANMSKNLVGWIPYSSYRPPQVAVDIAHRNFTTPVEMHNAKPFYHLDFDNYADWKGDTQRSRRFEFETLYLEKNYTLGSVASNVPDGRHPDYGGIGCFSEERLWMLGVTGTNGAYKIHGKSGSGSISSDNKISSYWGRNPCEQIGQYRNVLMRLLKGDDLMWIVIPSACNPSKDGNMVFADLGSDVYCAVIPWNSSSPSEGTLKDDPANKVFKWSFSTSQLGALVVEVGTKAEHGSFTNFVSSIKNNTSLESPSSNQLEYTSTAGRSLSMEHTGLNQSGYEYWDKTPSPVTHTPAGKISRVWCDGNELDFSTWQSYHVVSGENIVEQNWGSAALTAQVGGKGIQIIVDRSSAEVEYRAIDGAATAASAAGRRGFKLRNGGMVLSAHGNEKQTKIIAANGRVMSGPGVSARQLPEGIYTIRGERILMIDNK